MSILDELFKKKKEQEERKTEFISTAVPAYCCLAYCGQRAAMIQR